MAGITIIQIKYIIAVIDAEENLCVYNCLLSVYIDKTITQQVYQGLNTYNVTFLFLIGVLFTSVH